MEDQLLQGHSILTLLENPALLETIPLEKLHEWKNAFPYSANIQLLYTFRYFLNEQELPPEFLEETALRIASRQQLQHWFSQFDRYLAHYKTQQNDFQDEPVIVKKKKKKKKKKNKIKEGIRWKKLIENQQPEESPKEIDEFSSPFLRWLYSLGNTDSPGYRDLEMELQKLGENKKDRTATEGEGKKEWIDESLHDDKQITSEALAEILVNQGHYEKAIEMYERLSLKFPEKIAFFAAQIEDLSKKLSDKKD